MPIDMSAAKAPPRKRTASPAKVTSVASTETRSPRELREEGLNGIAQLAQALCLFSGQFADARAIGMHAGGLSHETAVLADHYEYVAAPIDMLIKIGPFTAVIAAGMPLVMQILTNHKVIDAVGMSGVVAPDVLDSQMKAEIARMQAQALREQQAAIQEAQAAQAEYERMVRQNDSAPVSG